MDRDQIRALLEELVEGLERLVEQLERADELLERGADVTAVRGAVRSGRRIARSSSELVQRALEATGGSAETGGSTPRSSLESLVSSRGTEEGWEIDLDVGSGVEELSRDRVEVLSEILADALDYFAGDAGVEGIDVDIRSGDGRLEATVGELGSDPGPPELESPTAGLRHLRETVAEAGGEVQIETSWSDGTRLVITLDGPETPE